MDWIAVLPQIEQLASAAAEQNETLFQLQLGEVLDRLVDEEGLQPDQLLSVAERLCTEFEMDPQLARQVVIFVAEAPGDPGVPLR